MTPSALSAAQAVDAERLSRRHQALSAIGATAAGGMSREALTSEDIEARRLILTWAAERGFAAAIDPIGNMFIRRQGRSPGADPVLTGSHVDSQPAGGAYDGAYGVLAGFETLEALEDADVQTSRPVELVVWTNEEGSRFQPTTMGSGVFVGEMPLTAALEARDRTDKAFGDELERLLAQLVEPERRSLGFPVHVFLEAHIEQGPILERSGRTIGVVRSIQGLRWFTVRVSGATGHAGTTPLQERRDALRGAASAVNALYELAGTDDDRMRLTVGRFEVAPGSPNTIPGSVLFTVDLRHPDDETLRRIGDQVATAVTSAATPCDVSVHETLDTPPTPLDVGLCELISQTSRDLGWPPLQLDSGATHDAQNLALHTRTGMVFIPCRAGLSHTEAEHADMEWMVAGTRVLAATIAEVAA